MSLTPTHPFPFIGAGQGSPFEGCQFYVRLQAPPQEARERMRGVEAPPVPLALSWDDDRPDSFWLSSGVELHAEVAQAHGGADPGGLATPQALKRFDKAIEDWLLTVHAAVPIQLVLRPIDTESDMPRFSAWHRWSIKQAPGLLALFDEVLTAPRETPQADLARDLITMAAMSRVKLPEPWKAWARPGRQVFAHLAKGHVDKAAHVLARHPGNRILVSDMATLARMVADDETGAWARLQHARWPQDVLCDAATLQEEHWRTIRGPLRAGLLALAVDLVRLAAPLDWGHRHHWDHLLPTLVEIALEEADGCRFLLAPAFGRALAEVSDPGQVAALAGYLDRAMPHRPLQGDQLAALRAIVPQTRGTR